MAANSIVFPLDPIIDVIARDVKSNPVFQKRVSQLKNTIVPYRNTLHPSDELMEAWYRFKENQLCQP